MKATTTEHLRLRLNHDTSYWWRDDFTVGDSFNPGEQCEDCGGHAFEVVPGYGIKCVEWKDCNDELHEGCGSIFYARPIDYCPVERGDHCWDCDPL